MVSLKIDDLALEDTIKEKLYPRSHFDYRKVIEYASAMKTGAKFPPILVGVYEDKKYVVDGVHRVKAYQAIELDHVDATIKQYKDKGEMFEDAVRLNSMHGMGLKFNERAVALRRMLEEYKISKARASEILGIPIPKFTVFLERTFKNKNGEVDSFKASVWKSMRQQAFDEKDIKQVADNIDQDIVTSTRITSLLKELLQALKNDLLPLNIPEVKELTSEIYLKLKETLEL